jgi:hypothetical protein
MSGRACHCRFGRFLKIEVVCSKQRGVFPCQGSLLLKIRWLTLQHGYVHALCFSSPKKNRTEMISTRGFPFFILKIIKPPRPAKVAFSVQAGLLTLGLSYLPRLPILGLAQCALIFHS